MISHYHTNTLPGPSLSRCSAILSVALRSRDRMVNSRGGNVDLLLAEDNTKGVEAHKMGAVELLQNDYHNVV